MRSAGWFGSAASFGLVVAAVLAQTGSFQRGAAAFRTGNWLAAEEAFRRAVAEKPKDLRAWKMLGMTYAAQERYQESIDPFARACALNPREEKACYYLGRAYYSTNRFEQARKAFEGALQVETDRARVYHGLALTAEAVSDLAEAERLYSLAVGSNDPEILADYGMFLFRLGRGRESLAVLRRAGATGRVEQVTRILTDTPEGGESVPVLPVRFEREPLKMVVKNGAYGKKHQVETMIAGVAVFDYDNDGWPDIFVANGAPIPSLRKSDPSFQDRLFRNRGDGTFEDVTERAGVGGEGYSMGVAAADYDNDGWTDLFVAGVRFNSLYRNRGDGTFEDVSARAGLRENGGWSIAAGWFDYDNDGWLDLFVARYVIWDPATEPFCGDPRPGYRAYCHPRHYTALPNALYRNNGDGTFRDVSAVSGITAHAGKGMGVAFGDYDGDGRLDVFVANDTVPNFLFHNDGNSKFTETSLRAGVALNADGVSVSSMGCEFRDYDNDGREDLFVTALTNERFVLFRNTGPRGFTDMSSPSGIAASSIAFSGWSAGVYDLNNDGFKDLFSANGNVMDNAELLSERKSRQGNTVFLNRGGGRFQIQTLPGEAFHRGAAFGDFDRDGRIDVAVTRLNEAPVVLRNVTPGAGHWVRLRLTGRRSNRDGIGARIHLVTADREQWNRVTTSTGFAGSSERIVHFGLGGAVRIRRIEVEWPSGSRTVLEDVAADQLVDVIE